MGTRAGRRAGARLPVRVEDPRYRRTTQIDGTGCWLVRWRRMSRQELCGTIAVGP